MKIKQKILLKRIDRVQWDIEELEACIGLYYESLADLKAKKTNLQHLLTRKEA